MAPLNTSANAIVAKQQNAAKHESLIEVNNGKGDDGFERKEMVTYALTRAVLSATKAAPID